MQGRSEEGCRMGGREQEEGGQGEGKRMVGREGARGGSE